MSVALSPDGKRALSGGGDQTMRLWNLETGEEMRTFMGHTKTVWDVAFSPDGKTALSGCSDGKSRLWDIESGKELQALDTIANGTAWTVAFAGKGKQAVTGGGNHLVKNDGPAPPLLLWDLTTGQQIRPFVGHTKDIRNVAVSPDGKQLLSGSFDGTMRLWDLATGKELKLSTGLATSSNRSASCPTANVPFAPMVRKWPKKFTTRTRAAVCDFGTSKAAKNSANSRGTTAPFFRSPSPPTGGVLVSGSADRSLRVWQLTK